MPPPYKNSLWLQGVVTSHPVVKSLSERTKVTAFYLTMVERWVNSSGEPRERKNRVLVEVVGRDSAYVAKNVEMGTWVSIEGYIRSEQFKGQEIIKVRTFCIDIWEEGDG